jgi:hypothetical protein
MSFVTPQTYVSFLACGPGGLQAPRSLEVQAYDSTGTEVVSMDVPLTAAAQRIEISGSDIQSISYAAQNPFGAFVIDDVVFVPEPSVPAILLAALGVTAAWRKKHRQLRRR